MENEKHDGYHKLPWWARHRHTRMVFHIIRAMLYIIYFPIHLVHHITHHVKHFAHDHLLAPLSEHLHRGAEEHHKRMLLRKKGHLQEAH